MFRRACTAVLFVSMGVLSACGEERDPPTRDIPARGIGIPRIVGARTYWIDEAMDFTGGGCSGVNLNNVTGSLDRALAAAGWRGAREVDDKALPRDFIDSMQGGNDIFAADSATLAVFAGHGKRGLLLFSHPSNGRCHVTVASETRLGKDGGAKCAYVMYVSSCTMHTDSISLHLNNNVRQIFGFKNSPKVGDHQPRDFFEATATKPNATAWLDEMDETAGMYMHFNSPICMTFGQNAYNCYYVERTAQLKKGTLLEKPAQPYKHWTMLIRDNGDRGCRRP